MTDGSSQLWHPRMTVTRAETKGPVSSSPEVMAEIADEMLRLELARADEE